MREQASLPTKEFGLFGAVLLVGIVLVAGSVILLISLCALSGCSAPKVRPKIALQPPVYPGATHATTRNDAIGVTIITFETNDKPQAVQDYYKRILQAEGWQLDYAPVPVTPDSLYFSWRDPAREVGYELDLTIWSNSHSDVIKVEIELVEDIPR